LASVTTIRVESESAIGALRLLRNTPGQVHPSSPLAPAILYLENLAPSGKRSQKNNLVRAARVLTGDDHAGLDYEWRELRSGHLEFLRGALKKRYAPSLINSTLSALRGVARWAWHLGQMPLEAYERIKDVGLVRATEERRRPVRALSVEEICALFASCESENTACALRDAVLLALLYRGGLRRDEACNLPLAAYNRRKHTLSVKGKGGRTRTIFFDDGGARRALNAWLRLRGLQPGPLLCAVNRHNQILPHGLSTDGLYRALMRRLERAGLEHCTPHDLRRTLGTHLRDEGVDLDLIRQLLGHVEIRTTQIYLLTDERQKKKAMQKIKVDFRSSRGKKRRRGKRRGSNWRQQVRAKL
jgi:site-specific recombinase XerD